MANHHGPILAHKGVRQVPVEVTPETGFIRISMSKVLNATASCPTGIDVTDGRGGKDRSAEESFNTP